MSKSNSLEEQLKEERGIIPPNQIQPLLTSIWDIINPTNKGREFEQQICSNVPACGSREMNLIINQMPIFLIIAHSTEDVYIERTIENKLIMPIIEQRRSFFSIKPLSDITQNKFVVYTSAAGTAGMLDPEVVCENNTHILANPIDALKSTLLRPASEDHTFQTRLDIIDLKEFTSGHSQEKRATFNLGAQFCLPGTMIFDKGHQFFGTRLTGHGFGIIRLNTRTNYDTSLLNTAQNLLKDRTVDDDDIYFISDDGGETDGDRKLINLIERKSRGLEAERKEVYMSEMIDVGDPGIYINLSCSSLVIKIKRLGESGYDDISPLKAADPKSPFKTLYKELIDLINNKYTPALGNEWDVFTRKLNYNPRIPGGLGEVQATIQSVNRAEVETEAGTTGTASRSRTRGQEKAAIAASVTTLDYVTRPRGKPSQVQYTCTTCGANNVDNPHQHSMKKGLGGEWKTCEICGGEGHGNMDTCPHEGHIMYGGKRRRKNQKRRRRRKRHKTRRLRKRRRKRKTKRRYKKKTRRTRYKKRRTRKKKN